MISMSIESPRPSANTNVKDAGRSFTQLRDVQSVGPSLVVVEGRPNNNAIEPSAHELTLARRGSSRNGCQTL
jgi:hypothetical protein